MGGKPRIKISDPGGSVEINLLRWYSKHHKTIRMEAYSALLTEFNLVRRGGIAFAMRKHAEDARQLKALRAFMRHLISREGEACAMSFIDDNKIDLKWEDDDENG